MVRVSPPSDRPHNLYKKTEYSAKTHRREQFRHHNILVRWTFSVLIGPLASASEYLKVALPVRLSRYNIAAVVDYFLWTALNVNF